MTETTKKVSEIIFREDLYPRINRDPKLVQKYAENVEMLPAIEINQHNELIDGWHRLTAHKTVKAEEILVTITETKTDIEFLALAIQRNAAHGMQLSEEDKKSMAVRLFNSGTGYDEDKIHTILSVSTRSVRAYLKNIKDNLAEEQNKIIFDMWMACYTQEEIAKKVGLSQPTVVERTKLLSDLERLPKPIKLSALYQDADWQPPIYNIWNFAKKTNEVSHFGNSEQRIVDNLLYTFTQPFDIVVDPFAGGGSTIDVCKTRSRRFYVSDRIPIPAREHEIRLHDIKDGVPPLNKNWSEVSLTYLDPPYWRQAQGKYSKDKEDLANMPLDQFTKTIVGFTNKIMERQSKGAISLLIQPTQWNADNHEWTDHVLDICAGVKQDKFKLFNRVSCPYSTEQCNPQMVNEAKDKKFWLALTRELIVWRYRS